MWWARFPERIWADEIVMIGAHLDSFTAGTGATDNASGCAVVLEAMRILKAIGAKPRRTIRMALWSSEEGGLKGSGGYVRNHFGNPRDGKKPDYDKLSVYFNMDNGTGQFRGVHLQGNQAGSAGFFRMDETFLRSESENALAIQQQGHRPLFLRSGRIARLSVYPGPARLSQPDLALQHGPVRSSGD